MASADRYSEASLVRRSSRPNLVLLPQARIHLLHDPSPVRGEPAQASADLGLAKLGVGIDLGERPRPGSGNKGEGRRDEIETRCFGRPRHAGVHRDDYQRDGSMRIDLILLPPRRRGPAHTLPLWRPPSSGRDTKAARTGAMSSRGDVHVLPSENGWSVEVEGPPHTRSTHPTQAAAVKAGRDIARKNGAELLIHRKDGEIRDRRAYGPNWGPCTS
jgi:Uncharacterized protein conserved in bacteria (DUF2188)